MTGLETGPGFELGVAAGPEVVGVSGSVVGTGPEPGDGVGFGSGAGAVFGPESEPEAVTEPGVVVGPEAVAEPEVGFAPVFEVELAPVSGTEVGPLTGAGSGPGVRFGFGTETAPEVEFEQGAVLGLGVVVEFVAETELGPGGGFGLVLGPGDAAFVGLGLGKAGPEFVHGFGLEIGVEVEYGLEVGVEVECGPGLGAGAEVGWVSW